MGENGTSAREELMSARPEAHAGREFASEHAPSPDSAGNNHVAIAPAMLTLIDLDQQQIDSIAKTVPGGAENIQDIYPLSPLQEAMLFQHLLNEQSDTYVLSGLFELRSHSHVVGLINGLQRVIARHDALRSAILWEKLPRPVQVVYRKAALSVEQVALERDRDPVDQLKQRMRMRLRQLDLRQAPLLRLQVVMDPDGERWYALIQRHHIVFDHQSWNVAFAEAMSCMVGQERGLPPPQSYRRYVAWSMGDAGRRDAEVFFRQKLGDVEEPTAPLGLLDVSADGTQTEEAHELLHPDLAQRIRSQAAALGTSAARLFHAAWALVVAHTSSRDDVVLGTVLMSSKRLRAQVERMIGLFVNTLPLRLSLKDVTARELIERTDQALRELLNFQHVSPALAQSCSGSKGKTPLFTAVLNYRYSAGHSVLDPKDGAADAAGIRVVAQQYRTNFPIMLVVDDLGDGFTLVAQTDRRIDPHRVIGYVTTAMSSLLDALERAPQKRALTLPILPEAERQLLVEQFNATKVARSDRLIHELFEEQVRRTPGATAAVYEGQSITYAELNRQANRLARYLMDHGVRPDQPVGICAERGVEMVIGVVGILKAGGAYVPLDPNYPTERLQYMLDDANPRVVLTQEKLRGTLPETQAEVVALDALLPRWADDQGENLPAAEVGLKPQNLVYVIYTSGTTGRPKGTAMAHHSMVNLIEWHRENLPAHEGQRVLQFAALSFDVAFQEIFTTLCMGGTLVLLDEWVRRDARALLQLMSDQAIERMFLPPLMLQSLAEHFKVAGVTAPGSLRDVITAGEQLRISPEISSFFRHLNGCRLHNHYGPTETHVVTALTLAGTPDEWPALPAVGRPIANTQIYVLDGQRQPVPLGVVGEIYIGGANVARGYLNRPELTEQRFVADPFSDDARACLYKTGDLGRWRADGVLEYLGRNDDQVKIRGFRIELGEIEAQLALHPQVKEAAVVAREDVPGEKRLVAYVTPREQVAPHEQVTPNEQVTPSAEELRNHLQTVLPEHMIPSAFVTLQSLPLTPSGKLNRRALPAPEIDAYVSRHYEAPQGESEQILARIWQELLRVKRVGRHDNFFELGGHSLLIVQMMERLRRSGLSANVRDMYESRTLATLACTLARAGGAEIEVPPNLIPAGCEKITPQMLPLVELQEHQIEQIAQRVPGGMANIQDIYPLAPLQDGMLFHHLLAEGGGDVYVVSMLLSMASREQLEEFRAALQCVIDRHDILRTAVLWEQLPSPVQVVCRKAALPVEELSLASHSDPVEQLKEWMRSERQRIDLRYAPLLRLQVAADPRGERRYAILRLHHLIGDHESLDTLLAEVITCLKGRIHELPEPRPYRNHVAQVLMRARTQDVEGFFRGKLAEVDEATAPFGLVDVHGDGSQIDAVQQLLEPALSQRVRAQARRLEVSAATLFHVAWGLVVSRASGRDDVVFGTVLLGRLQGTAGAHRTLGLFMNTLPLRLQLRGASAEELVERTQRELVDLLDHEQASLAIAQRCSGITGSAPLFNTLLNYRWGTVDFQSEFASVGMARLAIQSYTNYPIMLSVMDKEGGFLLDMQTDRRIDPHRVIGYVTTAMRSLLDALEQAPQQPPLSLPILSEEERQLLVEQFNATKVARSDRLIHELFEEQVRRTPGATAAVYEGQSITYAELNRQANRLARYLMDHGVRPDQPVGICAERGVEMVVGVLGVLKAGGAYVPLDPNYPTERLQYMLDDANPRVVLTQEKLRGTLPETQAEVVALDALLPRLADDQGENLPAAGVGLRPQNLVYVIYTSGTTGRPKGTAMAHHSMVNLIEWHRENLPAPEGQRVLQFAALSFDVAFQEIFTTLCLGGTLVLLDEWVRRDARALMQLLSDQAIERMFLPPLMLQSLAEHFNVGEVTAPGGLRDVITAGEQLRISPEISSFFRHLNGCRLHNHYGPTETHVVTALTLAGTPNEWPALPAVGRPLANTQIYILDGQRQPVPLGVVGEIYIGGANVARGYLNRPELTEQRFVADPFSGDARASMYKTGDLGRWRADGVLEYLGRNDDQVKIRGFRIELGEIETQLALHPQVKEAAVVAREDVPGEKRLVAYVTPREQVAPHEQVTPSAEELRNHLQTVLPEHMIPSAFVTLESLPLTPSGKLNRRALPAPELDAYVSRQYEAPQGESEQILARIWQELLRVERVGRHDNFFELGGHSLLALRLIVRIVEECSLHVNLQAVFQNPTIQELGLLMQGAQPGNQLTSDQTQFEEIII